LSFKQLEARAGALRSYAGTSAQSILL